MSERPQPDVTAPTVNIQDVEHDARPETRVNNAGVPVKDHSKDDVPEVESHPDDASEQLPPD